MIRLISKGKSISELGTAPFPSVIRFWVEELPEGQTSSLRALMVGTVEAVAR